MLLFSVIFGHFAHISSNGVPYPIFSYCGLLPWLFFSQALGQSSLSLLTNVQIVSKVYFPRIAIPLAAIGSCFIDFAVGLVLLIGMMIYYHVPATSGLLYVPLFTALATVAATGAGLWLSALSVRFRDVAHIVPFLLQLWMFATPVIYPASILAGRARMVLALNPMAGVVEGFRWAILGVARPDAYLLIASAGVSLAVLVSGSLYFHRAERTFADLA
jgi:lipopolysaccharide transport system permease protein